MDFIHSWIMSVTGAVVFSAICEMLSPDGNSKKYVRLVLGMIIIIAVVKPFVDTGERDLFIGSVMYIEDVDFPEEGMQDESRNVLINAYKKNLRDKIITSLESVSDGIDVQVEVVSEGDITDEKFGSITEVLVIYQGEFAEGIREDIRNILENDYGTDSIRFQEKEEV